VQIATWVCCFVVMMLTLRVPILQSMYVELYMFATYIMHFEYLHSFRRYSPSNFEV